MHRKGDGTWFWSSTAIMGALQFNWIRLPCILEDQTPLSLFHPVLQQSFNPELHCGWIRYDLNRRHTKSTNRSWQLFFKKLNIKVWGFFTYCFSFAIFYCVTVPAVFIYLPLRSGCGGAISVSNVMSLRKPCVGATRKACSWPYLGDSWCGCSLGDQTAGPNDLP